MIGRIWPPVSLKTVVGKCDHYPGLFGNRSRPSTRNTNWGIPCGRINPAVLWLEFGGGQKKTGAVLSRKTREFAPGYYLKNWRGRQGQSGKDLIALPVPKAEETHFIPSVDLTWTLKWGRITNGELVAIDALCAPTPSIPGLCHGLFAKV